MKRIIKCFVMGLVAMGFVACDSISGVFDKFSYDEVFEGVSDRKREICEKRRWDVVYYHLNNIEYYKFIPPSELADEEKGLIGVCEYTEIKSECKTGQEEYYTGLRKVDKKSGTLLIENKYKVITTVEVEYGEDKNGQGFCKKREIYKLKRGQPKE